MRTNLPAGGMLSPEEEAALPEEERRKGQEKWEAKQEYMSPPGAIKHELLDRRRLAFGILDPSFSFQPFGDRIAIHQVSRLEGEKYSKHSKIVMAPSRQRVENENNPVGIIVGAGAQALDSLRMNGMDLGHMITFLRLAPWRYQTVQVCGEWNEVLMLTVGDIVGSFDLMQQLNDGETTLEFNEETYQHYYKDKNGDIWYPQRTTHFTSEDM